jgi:hypothetical protein
MRCLTFQIFRQSFPAAQNRNRRSLVRLIWNCLLKPAKRATLYGVKTEVYSWRPSRQLKADLQRYVCRCGVPVSVILDQAVRDWLKKNDADYSGDEAQRGRHTAAARCFGVFARSDSRRSEKATQAVRRRLLRRRAR